MSFTLHPQLQADCYILGRMENDILLLHKNALVPWFILVPETNLNELYKLPDSQLHQVQLRINAIAKFVDTHFNTDKINIATLGNIVPIIGRFTTDFCWPAPVWGQSKFIDYTDDDVLSIKQALHKQGLLSTG